MFNDGRERELLFLVGTIPVPYKGQNYNIPISIILLDTHPYHAPLAFVKPTPDMQIKVSKHVDASGKIYLPYLHEWSYPNSDLVGLVQICVITFSEQPPVFARPKQQPNLPYPIHGGGGGGGYPPPSVGMGGQYPPVYPPTNQSYQQRPNTGTITADHIRASILSAVEDKVRRRLREDVSQVQAEVDSLRKVQEELNQGSTRLNTILTRVEEEDAVLTNNIRLLEMKTKEVTEVVSKVVEGEEINCDEAVTATNPLYKQLMTAYAEEASTEDAIYFLGEALRKGSLDTEQFLKQAREVSRKQFMLRATMMKCREKAGLSQY